MQTWCLFLTAIFARCLVIVDGKHLIAQASDLSNEYPSPTSLCGENLAKETGMLVDLYYVYYKPSANMINAPVILWLSGGPGCSGLFALFFENGPCSFDVEINNISLNPYAWTGLAHMIYLDQPKGTGYSDGDHGITHPWSLVGAADNMYKFLQQFYIQHPELKNNDFYIFGESYAGHYVPELAVRLLNETLVPAVKGIAIGNGVVSTSAWVESIVPYLNVSEYGYNFLGRNGNIFRDLCERFKTALARCRRDGNLSRLPASPACSEALQILTEIESATTSAVRDLGRNIYDVRLQCHRDDTVQLCYRFSRLQAFVNAPSTSAYFTNVPHVWRVCSPGGLSKLAQMDQLRESELNVAQALEHGVRVVVYGGDADSVVNWMSQDSWTRDLSWQHHAEFSSTSFSKKVLGGQPIGLVRTSHGLSFMKVFNAGHMVAHDQPATAYEIVRSFLYDTPGVGMFS